MSAPLPVDDRNPEGRCLVRVQFEAASREAAIPVLLAIEDYLLGAAGLDGAESP